MAHELDQSTGKTAFAFNTKNAEGLPWHGLGTGVEGKMTAAQALKLGGLNFDVETFPNTFKQPAWTTGMEPLNGVGHQTVRTDTMAALGMVGDRYHPVQNRDAFHFFDTLVERGEAIYETAGAIRGGAVTFLVASLPERFRIANAPTEEVKQYLLLSNAHDGSRAVRVCFTPVRVVCANTLAWGLAQSTACTKIRHTTSAPAQLSEASRALQITTKGTLEMMEGMDRLMHTLCGTERFTQLTELLFPLDTNGKLSTRAANQRASLEQYYRTGIGQADILGTAYGAMNALSGYFAHEHSYHNAETRFLSLNGGTVTNKMSEALQFLTA